MGVTARELKLRLGKYLAAVRAGQTVRVTLRGKPVAELCPIATSSSDRLDQLVAEGRARPGTGRLGPFAPQTALYSATAIVLADREDESP